MKYFEQLKNKHDKPKKAYLEYQLSKTIMKSFAYSDNINQDIKISMDLQNKINNYCEDLILDKKDGLEINFFTYFNVESNAQNMKTLYKNYHEHFDFLGIDRNMFINIASGMHLLKLFESAKNITWESLEILMEAENYNENVLNEKETKILLQNMVEDYGLQSLTFSKGITTKESLNKIEQSLNQLSIVIGCDKKQVGANKFNLFLDNENPKVAGYSTQYFNEQKLYLNEKISYDAFAHEWLHGIDNMLANHHKLDAEHASETSFKSINNLLKESKKVNPEAIIKIKEKANETCLSSLINIIKRFEQTRAVKDVKDFEFLIKQEYEKVLNNSWDKSSFIEQAKKYEKESSAIIPYLCSELELLKKMNNEKLEHSVFYNYALIMDKNLYEMKKIEEDYSITKLEMFARSFETYANIVLQEKGIETVISKNINNYTPNNEEVKTYVNNWKDVIVDIKSMLNEICPIISKNNEKKLSFDKILANIKDIKAKNINNVDSLEIKNKIKIG